ncbi:MAG: ral secretion pathway protein [Verrucomicrobiota bacterium]
MASSPSRTFLYAIFVRHDIVLEDRFGETPKPARETRALPRPAKLHAFTVVELLIVMAIILILAGLILATSSYVQKKGARSRAEAEIAAMSAALENYKADNGIYPTDTASAALNPDNIDSSQYKAASLLLYHEISGDRNSDGQITAADKTTPSDPLPKSYMPFKPQMMNRDSMSAEASSTNPVTAIRDPFGNPYGYSTAKATTPAGTTGYNPTFDLWSTSGNKEINETDDQYRKRWVKNW